MFAFFDYIIQFLYSVISWFGSLFHGLLTAITYLISSVPEVIYMAGFTPYFLSAAMWVSLFVFVINYILFHGNQ